MSDQGSRSTPPSGMPATVAVTSAARTSSGPDEMSASPRTQDTSEILRNIGVLREETAESFTKLDRKVDRLASEDDDLRRGLRRLEQRQINTDQDVANLREEVRRDRENPDPEKEPQPETL